ncbi:unnamed protein product [Kuraishia capsulata CBS 1993]|uniref:Lysyl-tRNA synthetase n=1 Tax=Kuraishia capsulata CBS 1993 TaxID=1382522 RepID=W6MRG4_9ASCO|nr:uncharacterized protein KUCA_T00005329001 [Kuraishia capsulata CBS 1993]CDK29341.1 unnamed protein product [Kuraishia capsulata CBS 1993]
MIRRGLTLSRVIRRFNHQLVDDHQYSLRRLKVKQDESKYYPLAGTLRFKERNPKILRIPAFQTIFQELETKTLEGTNYVLQGKVVSIRRAGKGMIFLDLEQDNHKVQIVASNKMMKMDLQAFVEVHGDIRPGDQVSCVGLPGRTNVGELSLKTLEPLRLASPALQALPPKLTDQSKIHGNRVMDYLVNKSSRDVILTRAEIIYAIREILNGHKFLEVQTPLIGSSSTGANATPFTTQSVHIKDNDDKTLDLHMRVAPEIWLKKMIISGFDKVYEIGQVFRNEGIDATHNPEFTTCEFYQTFATLEDLMALSEEMLDHIMVRIMSDPRLALVAHQPTLELISAIDENGGHFKKLEFIPTLERETGVALPSELTTETLVEYFERLNLPLPEIKSAQKLLNYLSEKFIEPLCGSCPTFIYHQPAVLSPLAKSTSISYGDQSFEISRRFEMFINGREYINAYEEENSPFQQDEKFKLQIRAKEDHNDDESIIPDEKFVEAMEWGMPPTGGWGMGIDRLTMLLTGSSRIDQVLTFGKMSDVIKQ